MTEGWECYFDRMSRNYRQWEFPGSPVVRTLRFHCGGEGSIPGWGTNIQQADKKKRKEKKRRYE